MFDFSVDPSGSSDSMDSMPPVQDPTAGQNVKGFYIKPTNDTFVQKYWHFNQEEAKKFMTTLCNQISAEIKHLDERAKETAEELKRSIDGDN